ncbi:MAG TPA: hypothetical protein VLF67_03285 [Candidatus Saccharimonas sp.]|nr:hypothetical protein [Candidatus Saccharimonas sp.]
MSEIAVIDPAGYDEQLLPSLGRIVHSETRQQGFLVVRQVNPPSREPGRPTDPQLHAGFVQHHQTGQDYYLNRLVYWVSLEQLGVWYTALYRPADGLSPHRFRPLHTPDHKGWLDRRANGLLPFRRA